MKERKKMWALQGLDENIWHGELSWWFLSSASTFHAFTGEATFHNLSFTSNLLPLPTIHWNIAFSLFVSFWIFSLTDSLENGCWTTYDRAELGCMRFYWRFLSFKLGAFISPSSFMLHLYLGGDKRYFSYKKSTCLSEVHSRARAT